MSFTATIRRTRDVRNAAMDSILRAAGRWEKYHDPADLKILEQFVRDFTRLPIYLYIPAGKSTIHPVRVASAASN